MPKNLTPQAIAAALLLLIQAPPIVAQRGAPRHATYDLHIHIDAPRARLEVSGTVHLCPAGVSRDAIVVLLSSRMKNVELRVVAPRRLAGGELSTDGAAGDQTWRIALPGTLHAAESVTLAFRYEGDGLSAPQLRVTSDGSLAGGSGEIWYPRLDFDSVAVGTLRFAAPAGETVLSNGVLNRRASQPDAGNFVYDVVRPGKFAFVSARYTRYQHAGTPRLNLFLLRPREDASDMLGRVARVLRALSGQFGPLPYNEYSVAEVEFGGSTGGTSESGFLLASQTYVDAGLPIPFIGHELGHAWWGGVVGTSPGAGRMMLTEGIASYAMFRALEQVEGRGAAETYRQSRYPGYETSGSPLEYFMLAAADIHPPLGTTTPRTQYEIMAMHRMANTRGWFLLDMLSREIGREKFSAILRGVVRDYGGRSLSWKEFRLRVEQAVAPRDVGWFFDDWFDRGSAPTISLSLQKDSRTARVVLFQADPVFRVTLPVRLVAATGSRDDRAVDVRDASITLENIAPFDVADVLLDPEYQVLRWTPDIARRARQDAPLTRADFQRRFGSERQSIELFRVALDSIPAPDSTGYAFAVRYSLSMALTATGDTTAGLAELRHALTMATRREALVPSAYFLLARVAFARSDTAASRGALRSALAADSSSTVRTITETIQRLAWARELLREPSR